MDRVISLLSKGYFPSQLPPCFSSESLANSYQHVYAHWLTLQTQPKRGRSLVPKSPESKSEIFSVARAGIQRRITSITNPVAQTYLATAIGLHWGDILKQYRQSSLSRSKPRFLKNGSRAANIPSMHVLYDLKLDKSVGYRFMLKTDISRFFPTVYTHSVPWAIHGKSIAKKNKNVTPKYFGNLIDLALRQCQDGQTIGLPIGPDTSHIIAEVISVAIDVELRKKLKGLPAGFRFVDDYYLFFTNRAEAENALAILVRLLQDFELQLNFEKTKICSVIEIADDYWSHQLRSFDLAKTGPRQKSDLNHFFEMAKELSKSYSDESVMTYALKKVASVLIRKDNWKSFETHISHVMVAHPYTLQTAARLLCSYKEIGYSINEKKLSMVINTIIEDHAPLGHHSEVVWCLWICKELKLTLSEHNIDLISEMQSSVCALILMDLDRLRLLRKSPKTSFWKNQENETALFSEQWLLSYEAGIRGWGGLSDTHIIANPYFAVLALFGVRFYDEDARIKPFFQLKIEDHEDGFDWEDIEDLEEYVEFEDGDGGYEGVVVEEDDNEL